MSVQDALALLRKAQRLYVERNYEMALVELDEAANLAPDIPEIYFWRGKTLATDLNEENIKAGIEEISHAINLKPDYAEAYFERGLLYLQLGELDKAAEDFKKAVKLSPRLSESYVYLAQIELAKGNTEKALEYIQKASGKESEDNYKYYFYFGKIYFNNKDYEKAVEFFTKALEKNPYLVDAYDLRSQALKELGRYEEAVEDLKRAYTLMPEEKRFFVEISDIYFKIAKNLYEKGDIIKAADYIVKGMEINYDIKLDDFYKNILIKAGEKATETNPRQAILFFDFALRLIDEEDIVKAQAEKEEIKNLRKRAISKLPLKERILKKLEDIYT